MLNEAEVGVPGGWEPVVQAPQLSAPSCCRMQVMGKKLPGMTVTSLEREEVVGSTRG